MDGNYAVVVSDKTAGYMVVGACIVKHNSTALRIAQRCREWGYATRIEQATPYTERLAREIGAGPTEPLYPTL